MSYSASCTDLYRRAAVYVDKILKGAKPADLPVEQPKKSEFIVNLKAAKQIEPGYSAERVGQSGQSDQVMAENKAGIAGLNRVLLRLHARRRECCVVVRRAEVHGVREEQVQTNHEVMFTC